MIYKGSDKLKAYVGSIGVDKMYLGDTLVYGNESSGLEYVDYIETAGEAYLNTGIIQRSRNFEYTITLQYTGTAIGTSSAAMETFFGYMASGRTTPRSGLHKYYGRWTWGTNATLEKRSGALVDNNLHTITVSGNATTQIEIIIVDGESYTPTSKTTSQNLEANTIPFYLGCRNRNGSVENKVSAKFYGLNYKYFGEASHTTIVEEYNLVPACLDGVYGMYETLTHTFISSLTGTPFTGG